MDGNHAHIVRGSNQLKSKAWMNQSLLGDAGLRGPSHGDVRAQHGIIITSAAQEACTHACMPAAAAAAVV